MAARRGLVRATLVLAVAVGIMFSATGCGYLKNVRDDLMDCGTLAIGVVPPVVPTSEGTQAVGFLPPSIGVYAEFTELCHFGILCKATGDLEWDRRGAGVTVDVRRKFGLGPLHHVFIEQTPVLANAYKTPDNEMDGWREHMRELSDPVFDSPAKIMIFEPIVPEAEPPYPEGEPARRLPYLSRGWQDWEFISLEVAIPEPFILHSGFYVRVGVDPSQIVDLALSLLCIDMYDDAAYEPWSGDLKY